MTNVARFVLWGVVAVLAVIVLSVFVRFLLEFALIAALLATAYYLFTRATHSWRHNRPWR